MRWSEVAQSCPTLCDPMDSMWPHGPTRLLHPWNFLGKSTGVDCHFLLQGIFLTWGSNPGFLHCGQTLYRLSHQRIPKSESRLAESDSLQPSMDYTVIGILRQEYWSHKLFPSPGDLPNPGIELMSTHTTGGFFTSWAPKEAPHTLAQNALPESNHKEMSNKPKLRNILQNKWSTLIKISMSWKTMKGWGQGPD